jgi:hypothetical protein
MPNIQSFYKALKMSWLHTGVPGVLVEETGVPGVLVEETGVPGVLVEETGVPGSYSSSKPYCFTKPSRFNFE